MEDHENKETVERIRREGYVDMWIDAGQGGLEEVARRFGIDSVQ